MGLTQKLGTIPLAVFTDSSNNVGIGAAANASYKLQVTGTTNLTGALSGTSGTFSSLEVYDNSNSGILKLSRDAGGQRGQLQFGRNNGGSFQVTGMIGSDSDSASPNNGTLYFYTSNSSGVSTERMKIYPEGQIGIKGAAATEAAYGLFTNDANTGFFNIFAGGSGTATKGIKLKVTNGSSTIDAMTITSGGNVGIGTSSPQNKLTINTPNRTDGETNSLGAAVVAGPISSSPSNDFTNSTAIFRVQGSDATNSLQFGIGGDPYGYNPWIQGSFDNSSGGGNDFGAKSILLNPIGGNVLIGATSEIDSSRYRLSVVGGDIYGEKPTGNMALVLRRVTNDTKFEISVQESRTRIRTFSTANDRDIYFDTDAAGTNRMIIQGNGQINMSSLGTGTVTATGGTLSTVSDMNLKDEDGFIDNALEKVLKLKPRYYHWKEESGLPTDLRQLGFYAQEVNEALGEEAANTPKSENDKWGIYDRGMIAFLTAAIQEQQKQIEELKALIAAK